MVVSVDYRLGPEQPYPAAVEDTVEALQWVHSKGPEVLGINPSLIAVGGSSRSVILLQSTCIRMSSCSPRRLHTAVATSPLSRRTRLSFGAFIDPPVVLWSSARESTVHVAAGLYVFPFGIVLGGAASSTKRSARVLDYNESLGR